MRMKKILFLLLACSAVILPLATSAQGADTQQLQQTLDAQNGVLAGAQGSLDKVQARLDAAQAAYDAEQAKLNKIQAEITAAHKRLVMLERKLQLANAALTSNLVGQYKGNHPDLVTVLMNSHGFAELVDTANFLRDVQDRNARILAFAKQMRIEVIAEATRLGKMQVLVEKRTAALQAQRNKIDKIHIEVLRRRDALMAKRDRTAAALKAIHAQEAALQGQINQRNAASAPGDIVSGGGFTFPMSRSAASAPGSWSLDQGVDITAPGGTALLAVGSGTVVLHGIGGFGQWAPVLHLDSGRYVYYGHAGPGNAVPIGTHVRAGQVISEVGAGIVGISTGPHLEIGFSDAAGTPAGGTAGMMMSLLQGSYGG